MMFEKIFLKPGYISAKSLTHSELTVIRNFVAEEISISTNKNIHGELLEDYHKLIAESDHEKISSKARRIFCPSKFQYIENTQLLTDLKKCIPGFSITSEENRQHPEIYWRIVRPNQPNDVGPLHADAWFWQMGIGEIDKNLLRIKLWVQIAGSEPGFSYIPNSHLFEFDYDSKSVNKKNKPVFNNVLPDKYVEKWPCKLGSGIIFNDRMLHGGLVGTENSRVSFEFTFTALREPIFDHIFS